MPGAKLMQIAQSTDPRDGIMTAIGDTSKIGLFSGRVLVATYIAPEKTAGGIIRPNSNVQEDIYQSAVGLVIRKGKLAFKDDDTRKFSGQDVAIGDWVTYRPGDAKRIQINGVECRIIEDTLIDMVVASPEIITHSK